MANLYVTQAGALALQAAGLAGWTNLKADAGGTAPPAPDRLAVVADFGIVVYTGYVQPAVTLTGGFVDAGNGMVYCLSGGIAFNGPSAGPGIDALSIVLTDGTTHVVWAWIDISDAHAQLNVATDHLQVAMQMYEDLSAKIFVVS